MKSIALIVGLMILTGCGRSIPQGANVVKFRLTQEEAFKPAPRNGTYVIAYRDRHDGTFWQQEDVRLKLQKGDVVGFVRGEDDRVVAVAAEQSFSLGRLPANAMYVCWYNISRQGLRDERLARNFDQVLKVAGAVGMTAGYIAARVAVEAALDQ